LIIDFITGLLIGARRSPDTSVGAGAELKHQTPYHDMHWIYLVLAIVFEVAGTTCMKLSDGFTRLRPAGLMWLCYAVCFYCLTLALKKVDVSVAYAIWSGIGTALIATIGVLYFREPITLLKTMGILAIIGGVVALNLSGGTH
jgi:small multidrug resistance pump